jgi:broad specificity phosphatase PhoE
MSRIILMRHGYTDYVQGNLPVSVEEANDLNEEGVQTVTSSAVEISKLLRTENEVVIYSSRMGRALHTAKIVRSELELNSISVDLIPSDELREVEHFNWALFEQSIRTLNLEIISEHTDKWFSLDPLNSLSPELIKSLPLQLQEFVTNVETAEAATNRLLSFLTSISHETRSKVLITHDGLLCRLLSQLTNKNLFTCTRSHYFELLVNSELRPTAVGNNNLGYRV